MHGLINRTIQSFVRDTRSEALWLEVAKAAELGFDDFEAMLSYDPALTKRALGAVACKLGLPQDALLEDMGTYLVSHKNTEAVRRLLRFGGVDFVEFLHSLDDLPDRARLAVDDLILPQLELRERSAERFTLQVSARQRGFGAVMMGVLRAMADDYGALVLLEYVPEAEGVESIDIQLIEAAFAEGRGFDLGGARDE
jgi:Haem-NO-binding